MTTYASQPTPTTTIRLDLRDEARAKVYEQLAAIDPDDLRDALLAITEGAPAHLRVGDVADPGPALAVGEEGRIAPEDLSQLERIVGPNNQLPVHFLEEGARVQRAVARVKLTEAHGGLPAGSGWGTGSLVAPSLMLTNNHVIPTQAFAGKVACELGYQQSETGVDQASDTYSLAPSEVFITDAALDYTLIRVRSKRIRPTFVDVTPDRVRPAGFGGLAGLTSSAISSGAIAALLMRAPGEAWGWLRLPAGSVGYAVGQRMNVIGHPAGRRKEVALQDNTITHVHANVLRYTTDTEPGSSGSPVFSNAWDLVALHHAGGDQDPSGAWLNNEGIRIDRIVDHLRANASAAVRAELGI